MISEILCQKEKLLIMNFILSPGCFELDSILIFPKLRCSLNKRSIDRSADLCNEISNAKRPTKFQAEAKNLASSLTF